MKILTVKDFTIKKPISTLRYYVYEAITILSGFALIAIMFTAFYVLTGSV